MIFRIYPTKDTVITNDLKRGVRMTGSNLGFSEELAIFKKAGLSGTIGTIGSASLGRSLLQFDFSEYLSLIAAGTLVSGTQYTLKMFHKTANGALPYSFDVVIKPVSSSWDEGRGLDVSSLSDAGQANWIKRSNNISWANEGGDFLSAPTASVHFDTGREDIDLDVTNIVVAWLTGGLANNGISLSLTQPFETGSDYNDYETKRFYSRHSFYSDRRPYIECRANDSITDDRSNMRWSNTGTLYMYNVVDGRMVDLPSSNVYVSIADSSGNLLFLTASHTRTGIYSASFALPSGSYSGSLFYDRWGSGSFSLMTGSFSFSREGPEQALIVDHLGARIRNLRADYKPEEVVRFEVVFRRSPRTLPVVRTTASLTQVPYVVETGFWAIENDATRERVIPFGTGSLQHTKMSYAQNGNYFDLSMSTLAQGNVYRIIFLVDEGGRRQMVDEGIKFKVI